jgi:PAS domain S-box-containing protein
MATVLIVDDERAIRLSMSAFLQTEGYDTFEAEDAAGAKAFFSSRAPDVAVIDILLGGDNGLDVAESLRDTWPNVQIILMSGQPDVGSARRAIRLGVFDYLAKPVSKAQIINVVQRANDAKQRADSLAELEDANRRHRDILEARVAARTAQLQCLADAAMELVEFPADGNLYEFAARAVHRLVGGGYAAACSVDEERRRLVVQSVCRLNHATEQAVARLLGRGIFGLALGGLTDEAAEQLLGGRLVEIEGGIYDMFFGKVPHAVCRALGATLGVDKVYSIGLRHGDRVRGNITVLTPPGCRFSPEAIEALTSQVAIVLERRATQQQVRQGEHRYKELVESLNDVVFEVAHDGRISYVSPIAKQMFGFAPDEAMGRPFAEFIHPDDLPRVQAAFEDALNDHTYPVEYRATQKNGDFRWVCTSSRRVTGPDGDVLGIRGVLTDISERKQSEEEKLAIEAQLRQSQKLEAIGGLAGGVAHEINNPINGIMNYAQIVRDRAEESGDAVLSQHADEILRETERVAAIVRNLLSFSRQEKLQFERASLRDIVEDTLSLTRTILRHDHVQLHVELPDDLPDLLCRSQQLQQVLMNLLTNARDSLSVKYPDRDDNKRITVSACTLDRDHSPWVRLTVKDLGTGIDADVRERMFEPFYTTKRRDKGTGLGLSISHGIVKEHGGDLTVESEPGQWARFHVDLPAIAGNG